MESGGGPSRKLSLFYNSLQYNSLRLVRPQGASDWPGAPNSCLPCQVAQPVGVVCERLSAQRCMELCYFISFVNNNLETKTIFNRTFEFELQKTRKESNK